MLLSFPRLWRNAGGFSSELEAYLKRSKSVSLEVTLSSPQLVVSIIPHTPRLVALTVRVDDSPSFNQIAEHLRDPIPTLRSLEIRAKNGQLSTLDLPSGLCEGLFRHLKSLSLNAILSFRGPQTFPHITELSLYGGDSPTYRPVTNLLNTLEQLPGLVKVSALFRANWYIQGDSPNVVTLPCLQEIHLRTLAVNVIPPILQFLELPKATSITLQSRPPLNPRHSIFSITSFSERLPNYVELPELRIDTTMFSGEVVFRSPSQAVFTYKTGALRNYEWERRLWGNLLFYSVRRVTAVLVNPAPGNEDVWLVDMLGDLNFLELLELGGDCGRVLQRLRHRLVRGVMQIDIKVLIVHGGEYAESQALKLESAKDDLGLENMTMTYIPDPEVYEKLGRYPDAESSSDDEDWDKDLEEYLGSDHEVHDEDE